jgi:hypothetical protein
VETLANARWPLSRFVVKAIYMGKQMMNEEKIVLPYSSFTAQYLMLSYKIFNGNSLGNFYHPLTPKGD